MKNERCSADHNWFCVDRRGQGGELVTTTPINPQGLELLQKDPGNASKVCTTGIIRCGDCNTYFSPEQQTRDSSRYPNITTIRARLHRIRSLFPK